MCRAAQSKTNYRIEKIMGRSVIPHPYATVTAYIEFNPSHYCDDCETFTEDNSSCPECGQYIGCDYSCDHSDDWDSFKEWIVTTAQSLMPSMDKTDREVSRWSENTVILDNRHSEVSVSEYSGLVAISLAPRSDLEGYSDENSLAPLGAAWRVRMSERFTDSLGTLQKLGTFSNGESVYRAA